MSQGSGSSGGDPYQTVAQMVPGQVIMDRYSLRKVLGRGGFGVVWLARDEQLEMDVAIKFLTDLIVSNPEAVEDLKRETRYSLRLTHPNIVRIYGFIQGSMVAGVSMEYIDGGSLSALKVRQPNRSFSSEAMAPVVEKLCDALQYAHTKVKIAHRDLKPGNLMLDSTGDLKVADFGISRSISDTHTALTRAVGTSGTPAFMSPQQMMGQPARVTDDIYSLGATVFDLLAGKPPFFTGDVAAQVATAEPPTIAQRREELGIQGDPVPAHWEETIRACLAKDEGNRPQNAAEVAQRLGLRVPVASMYVSDPGTVATSAVAGGEDSATETPPDARIATPRSLGSLTEPSGRGTAGKNNPLKVWLPVGAIVVASAAGFFLWQTMGKTAPPSTTAASEATPNSGETVKPDQGAVTASRGGDAEGAGNAATNATGDGESDGSRAADAAGSEPGDVASAETASRVPDGTLQAESIGDDPQPSVSSNDGSANESAGQPEPSRADPEATRPATTSPSNPPSRPSEGSTTPANPDPPPSPALTLSQARTALARGNLAEAKRKLGEARSIAPNDPQIGALAREIGNAEEAQELARRVSSLESAIPSALAAGEVSDARAGLNELARLNSRHPSLSGWRARLDELEEEQAQAETATAAAADETVILGVVDNYRRAMEAVDIDQFARLWQSMPGDRRNRYKTAFDSMTRQSLTLGTPTVQVTGDEATVSFSQKTTSHLKAGSPVQNEARVSLQMVRVGETWKIREMSAGG